MCFFRPSVAVNIWMPKRRKNILLSSNHETYIPKLKKKQTKNKEMLKYKTGKCKHKESGGGTITMRQDGTLGKQRGNQL